MILTTNMCFSFQNESQSWEIFQILSVNITNVAFVSKLMIYKHCTSQLSALLWLLLLENLTCLLEHDGDIYCRWGMIWLLILVLHPLDNITVMCIFSLFHSHQFSLNQNFIKSCSQKLMGVPIPDFLLVTWKKSNETSDIIMFFPALEFFLIKFHRIYRTWRILLSVILTRRRVWW